MKIGLRKEDTLCRSKWSVGINQIAAVLGVNLATLTCWGYYMILNIGYYLTKHWCLSLYLFMFV